MLYELINVSDSCVIESDDHLTACIACCLLGDGYYFLKPETDDQPEMPAFILGAKSDPWFQKHFDCTFEEALNWVEPEKMIACLGSFLYGSYADHRSFYLLTEDSTPERREEKRQDWNEKRRSSLTNIGKKADQYRSYYENKARYGEAAEASQDEDS